MTVTGFLASIIVPVEVLRLFPIVICVMSIESNFNFSIVCNTAYNVSIRMTPITILPPDFNLSSQSCTISCVSPPVPPMKIAFASGSSEIFSFALPRIKVALSTPNFLRFLFVSSIALGSRSTPVTCPSDSTCYPASTVIEPLPHPMSITV